jgi:alkanesulfonate monooxygenase SsuD/methylene tetrahydromethanopterin reductase-like flavin-dependent oxidoreductase (luciferase family)
MSVGLVLKDPSCDLVAHVAPLAEAHGFSHLMFTELSIPDVDRITGRDPFVLSSIALGATQRLHAGTAVAGTVFHTARHLALRAATLQEQSGGRFVLGCGVAHKAFADVVHVPYPTSPLTHAREYCDELRGLSQRLVFGQGFPVWLAALGDRMAATGAGHADGLLLNWVSPEWTGRTIERVVEDTGRRPTVAVLLRVDRDEALRRAANTYLTTFTNYERHFARQGLTSATEVADATGAPVGDVDRLGERIAAYHDAGADVVCVYPADMDAGSILEIIPTIPTT